MIAANIHHIAILLTSFIGISLADGLYSKGSGVLQINGKNYDKLIAKSGKTSVCL